MTKTQSNIFKTILFFLGIGIIFLAYNIFNTSETLSDAQKYFWINLGILYAVFFLPFFFSSITLGNIDKKVPSLVIVWTCIWIFELINIPLTITVLLGKVPVKIAILVEAIMFFVAAIFVYFSYFANTHIENVQNSENRALSLIKQMRSSLEMLNLKAGSLNDSLSDEKRRISGISENARYISPVETAESVDLEGKIIAKVSEINSCIDAVMSGSDSNNLKAQVSVLEMLINQRKLLRK